jgi:hypothetical protein
MTSTITLCVVADPTAIPSARVLATYDGATVRWTTGYVIGAITSLGPGDTSPHAPHIVYIDIGDQRYQLQAGQSLVALPPEGVA